MKLIKMVFELSDAEVKLWNPQEARNLAWDKAAPFLDALKYRIVGIEHLTYCEIEVHIEEVV